MLTEPLALPMIQRLPKTRSISQIDFQIRTCLARVKQKLFNTLILKLSGSSAMV